MIDRITAYLLEKYNPKAIIFHGSRLRQDNVLSSDYDLVIIDRNPGSVSPHVYNGCSLDLLGMPETTTLIKAGNTPIWPLKILFDDEDALGGEILQQTYKAFLKGPTPLPPEEWNNRQNYTKRLLGRLKDRGDDPMARYFYLGDFFDRSIRYWFEKNNRWTVSIYTAVAIVEQEDSAYWELLKQLWGPEYLKAAQGIYYQIFEGE